MVFVTNILSRYRTIQITTAQQKGVCTRLTAVLLYGMVRCNIEPNTGRRKPKNIYIYICVDSTLIASVAPAVSRNPENTHTHTHRNLNRTEPVYVNRENKKYELV